MQHGKPMLRPSLSCPITTRHVVPNALVKAIHKVTSNKVHPQPPLSHAFVRSSRMRGSFRRNVGRLSRNLPSSRDAYARTTIPLSSTCDSILLSSLLHLDVTAEEAYILLFCGPIGP